MHADGGLIAPQSGGASRREITSSVTLAAEHPVSLEKTFSLFCSASNCLFLQIDGRRTTYGVALSLQDSTCLIELNRGYWTCTMQPFHKPVRSIEGKVIPLRTSVMAAVNKLTHKNILNSFRVEIICVHLQFQIPSFVLKKTEMCSVPLYWKSKILKIKSRWDLLLELSDPL